MSQLKLSPMAYLAKSSGLNGAGRASGDGEVQTKRLIQAGTIIMWLGNDIPEGFVECDGTAYPATETVYNPSLGKAVYNPYYSMWLVFRDSYNTFRGASPVSSSAFRVPDLRGLFIQGSATTSNSDPLRPWDAQTSWEYDVVKEFGSIKYHHHGSRVYWAPQLNLCGMPSSSALGYSSVGNIGVENLATPSDPNSGDGTLYDPGAIWPGIGGETRYKESVPQNFAVKYITPIHDYRGHAASLNGVYPGVVCDEIETTGGESIAVAGPPVGSILYKFWYAWDSFGVGGFLGDFYFNILLNLERSSSVELCDGRELLKSSYPELYAAIGDHWGDSNLGYVAPSSTNYFRIPDLRRQFLRCHWPDDTNPMFSGDPYPNGDDWGKPQLNQFGKHIHYPLGSVCTNTVFDEWTGAAYSYNLTDFNTTPANPYVVDDLGTDSFIYPPHAVMMPFIQVRSFMDK